MESSRARVDARGGDSAPERRASLGVSRRRFLLASGTAVAGGTGLAEGRESAATVDASGAYAPLARRVAREVRRTAGADVSVRSTSAARGLERLRDGSSDVVVAARPPLSAERDGPGSGRLRFDVPLGGFAGVVRPDRWRSCLRSRRVESALRGDPPPVYAEVDPRDVDASTATPAPRTPTAARGMPAGRALVRGVRAHQYAAGFGGLGFYEVEGRDLDRTEVEGRSAGTTVVRLSYVHARRESASGSATEFVARLLDVAEAAVGDVTYFSKERTSVAENRERFEAALT